MGLRYSTLSYKVTVEGTQWPSRNSDETMLDVRSMPIISIGLGMAAAVSTGVPIAFGQTSVKAIFEKYNLLGTFASNCSEPANKANTYYVYRAIDTGHVQRDVMSNTTTRDVVFIIDKATELGPNKLAFSGTVARESAGQAADGASGESVYRVEGRRVRALEGAVEGKKTISGGYFTRTGNETPWLTKCDAH